ncbi:MAG: cobalamin-dependent protein [Candidatus Riflebacteria bacterium]|nr:cobalamin-dependent protein [Candidatus Riflebacteria bacterium]
MTEKLDSRKKIDVEDILQNLENYTPKRRGWTWRKKPEGGVKAYKFHYKDMSEPLKNSVPLPAAKYFDNIDPQPGPVITTEIASGRFEDDIRRMRMAAWHGADHIMVIRTTGQSHIDGLLEGTPEGVGGVPITRKQIRASRKACDLIEDEVGRPINFHSYVSGVAGPEVAVLFAEEGVNGAHQDPQYNVLYRNVNMYRSFIDAAEAKRIMSKAKIFQIDGAHNANATAKEGWSVMPELLVQHGINSAFSVACGMDKNYIGLSTVPPCAPPAPKLWYDLPYAVALRDFFSEFKMRAQQNTRYIEADIEEATRTHVIDTMISALTRADIQSTITPDEGRNVPWHYNNIRGIETAKQTFAALDGIQQLLKIDREGPLGTAVRELKEKAVCFLEEILEEGGYFAAVEKGFFVDSAAYPQRSGDGIARDGKGGVGAGSIIKRDADYYAPVCSHFGYNKLPEGVKKTCAPINLCTLCDPKKIVYIDELDPNDSCNKRLEKTVKYRKENLIKPEVEWSGDGTVLIQLFLPETEEIARVAAIEIAKKMNLSDPEVINTQVMHPAEGTFVEVKGKVGFEIDRNTLKIPPKEVMLPEEEIRAGIKKIGLKVVAGTVGEDEHSVGMREILDIKHGGIEKYGVKYHYLGTSVPLSKLVDAAIETGSHAILISTIISHNDVHRSAMKKLNELCREKGIRDKIILIAGGTQVTRDMAKETGLDDCFGRGTKGIQVVNSMVKNLQARKLI